MASLDGIRIRNFGVLKDITLGQVRGDRSRPVLTPMTTVIGKNGVGKSRLFDAFGFLADCLKSGVNEASLAPHRGGLNRLRSPQCSDPIQIELQCSLPGEVLVHYQLSLDAGRRGKVRVCREVILQSHRDPAKSGPAESEFQTVLYVENGRGLAWKLEDFGPAPKEAPNWLDQQLDQVESYPRPQAEVVEFSDPSRLALSTLGSLRQHPRISALKQFVEDWFLSSFTPQAARSLPFAGAERHLNHRGDNLGNVVEFMEQENPDRFRALQEKLSTKIPGVESIRTERTLDGRLLVRFDNRGFQDPFYAQHLSDGTLKVFAYLLLLEDPDPPPLLCIEEPENGIYHKLLEPLAQEFRDHASKQRGGAQVLVTTHQPYFVDALSPAEVWVLEKGPDGFSVIKRAGDDELVQNLVAEELPLGSLWYSDYLDPR